MSSYSADAEERKYHSDEALAQQAAAASSSSLAATHLAATTRPSVPPYLSPHHKVDEVGFTDAAWFDPRVADQHYRRPKGPSTNTFHDPPTSSSWEEEILAAGPFPTNVDGSPTEKQLLAQEKASFISNWKRQQEKALGLPSGASEVPNFNYGAYLAATQPQLAHQPAAPAAVKSKVPFRPMPMSHSTGPAFQFFPDDAPPPKEFINPHVTPEEVAAGTVEFLPLSTKAGSQGPGGGIWNKMSTWSKIQWNREGMKMEDGRNAKGTAEQVLYRIWKAANAKKGQHTTATAAEPTYKRKLADGTVLLTAAPPLTGSLVPPKPLPPNFLPHKTDKKAERNAMAMNDWNVLTVHDTNIYNPYDPIQRKAKQERLEAAKTGPGKGLFKGLTPHERQTRINIERERMVYEDCNAIGKIRKSSYRFIPKAMNRKMYATSWGPVYFGAGAPFGSAQFGPAPNPVANALGGWGGFAATPQEAWKVHVKNITRERNAMAGEDMDARTGIRHQVPENAWQASRKRRKKQDMEKNAMEKNDRNAVPVNGYTTRAGIYTAQQGPLQFSDLRGKRYVVPKPPTNSYNNCPHVYGDKTNRHPVSKKKEGVAYYKRSFDRMRNLLYADMDQSTNIQDQHAMEGVDLKHEDPDSIVSDTQLEAKLNSLKLAKQSTMASTLLSHGQAYSQRSRLRYRFIDVPGYHGPPVFTKEQLKAGAAKLHHPFSAPVVIKPVVKLDRNGKPIRKHRPGGKPPVPSSYDHALSTNTNTSYTLIPRWNEPDATFDPRKPASGSAAATQYSTYRFADEFVFDTTRPYVFDREEPWSPEYRSHQFAQLKHPWKHGSLEADIAAWPLDKPKKNLFDQRAWNTNATRRTKKYIDTIETLQAANKPAVHIPKQKLLSEYNEKQAAEYEEFLAAQRKLRPWDTHLGQHNGALGFQFGATAGGGASGFQAASGTKPGDVFFSPTHNFMASPDKPFQAVTPAFGSAAFSSAGIPVTAPHIVGAIATRDEKRSHRTAPALPYLPVAGAPQLTPLEEANLVAQAAKDAAAAEPLDYMQTFALAFEESLKLNPFRTPDQMNHIQSYMDAQKSAAEAKAALAKLKKDEKKKVKEEQKKATWKRAHDPFDQGLEPLTFTDVNARGQKTTYRAPSPDFTALSPRISSKGTANFVTGSPDVKSKKDEKKRDYKHPVFGRASNPFSQIEAFEKWQAWNDKYAPMDFNATASSKEYKFKPLGVGTSESAGTSSEDESEDEDDPFAFHERESAKHHAQHKRKHHNADSQKEFSFSSTTPSFNSSTSSLAFAGRSRDLSATQAILRSSRSKSRDTKRGVLKSPMNASHVNSTSTFSNSPFSATANATVTFGGHVTYPRDRSRSKSRGRSQSKGRRPRSISPEDPFEWHSRNTDDVGSSVTDAHYPRSRSSQQYTAAYDVSHVKNPVTGTPFVRTTTPYDSLAGPSVNSDYAFATFAPASPSYERQQAFLQQTAPIARTSALNYQYRTEDPFEQSRYNTRVTSSAFPEYASSTFPPQSHTSSASTIPPPASLGMFHTGRFPDGTSGFVPFDASSDTEHSNANAYAGVSNLSSSPTKRIKALRKERGSKRGEFGEDLLSDAQERAEWEAAWDRDEYRRRQEQQLHEWNRAQQIAAANQLTYRPQSTFQFAVPAYSYATTTTTTAPAVAAPVQAGPQYGGVHVNIHSPPAPAASTSSGGHNTTVHNHHHGGRYKVGRERVSSIGSVSPRSLSRNSSHPSNPFSSFSPASASHLSLGGVPEMFQGRDEHETSESDIVRHFKEEQAKRDRGTGSSGSRHHLHPRDEVEEEEKVESSSPLHSSDSRRQFRSNHSSRTNSKRSTATGPLDQSINATANVNISGGLPAQVTSSTSPTPSNLPALPSSRSSSRTAAAPPALRSAAATPNHAQSAAGIELPPSRLDTPPQQPPVEASNTTPTASLPTATGSFFSSASSPELHHDPSHHSLASSASRGSIKSVFGVEDEIETEQLAQPRRKKPVLTSSSRSPTRSPDKY